MPRRSTLTALVCLTLSACASTPSMMSISPTPPPPAACLVDCPPPPRPTVAPTAAASIESLLDWASDCRARHSDCAGWVRLHHADH